MARFEDFHGLHASLPRLEATAVQWSPVQKRTDRVRVRVHTCECQPVLFEQCMAGGLAFVRRHDRSVWPASVVESPWTIAREAEALWLQLMRGEAR